MKNQLRMPFYLAWQYIRRGRKWTLFLTLFLMSAAFINLIFISSLFTGIIDGTNKQIINTMTGNIYMTPKDGNDYISNIAKVLEELRNLDGIKGVSAQNQIPARLKYKAITGSWQILAINPDNEKEVTNISQKMITGSYLDKDDEDQIILGRQIAGGEGVESNAFSFKDAQVGDQVNLVFDGVSEDFNIKGIFYTKFIESDKRAFITEKSFKKLMPQVKDKATTIVIKTDENKNEQDVISLIKSKNFESNVYTWQEVAGLMKSVSESFLSINILMSFVGVLIAAVTIFIVIYVDIVNKRKQIGILRAIGIRPYIIISSYVILAAIYSVIGVILGTAIFFLIITPYFRAHPFVLPICDAVLVLSKADYIARAEAIMWVSVFSGLIPAAIITRTKMLDAILGK
jgi:putative ABC transport system permease protein